MIEIGFFVGTPREVADFLNKSRVSIISINHYTDCLQIVWYKQIRM